MDDQDYRGWKLVFSFVLGLVILINIAINIPNYHHLAMLNSLEGRAKEFYLCDVRSSGDNLDALCHKIWEE